MKKIFFYAAMTAFAVSVAGCSKDAEVSDIPAVGGKYTLASVSGSLDAEIGTRTGLGTNSVVNWSNKDRIAVINTKTNAITQYELVSGQGTSVGKFEPLSGSGSSYDDISDLKAVYPAIAATVSNGVISFSLNQNYTQERRSEYGIGSWNEKDSPYSFTYNDIKVSYNTPAVTSGSTSEVNFKFKQLGTWCTFAFDLSQSPYADESIEKMSISTTDGDVMIGGKAVVDLTDPVAPKLGAGDVNKIDWEFNTSSALGTPFNRSVMLFPAVAEGKEMKITCETEAHILTFFAKPTQDLSAGKVLRFPINEKFTENGTDFRYTVENKGNIPTFYYYGENNCYLVFGKNNVDIDITPYKSDLRFRKTGTLASGTAPQPTTAKLLWKENTLTGITVGAISSNKVPVTAIAGNGNAVVAIMDKDNNILWSYHIWVPEIDPTAGLLTYAIPSSSIGSGSTYEVMPIALGAMNKATVIVTGTADNNTNPKSFGLYYQWGRKDPLGRPRTITASGDTYVETTFDLNGSDDKVVTSWVGANNLLNLATAADITAETTDADMIKYATEHPTTFIYDGTGKYANYDWVMKKNDHLWGNGSGYLYPRKGNIYKSIYDPCPKGYRVAPKDLWNRFTVDGGNKGSQDTDAKRDETFNADNRNSLATQRGYFFFYQDWRSGCTDFYPASGYRGRASGGLAYVGSYGYSWSSSPTQSSASAGNLTFVAAYVSPQSSNSRANGFPVRCVQE